MSRGSAGVGADWIAHRLGTVRKGHRRLKRPCLDFPAAEMGPNKMRLLMARTFDAR